mmetsp:Transcript_14463/g.14522  ORF Transcript_14463/g.14522 Transcript_14463/m.14522 type:complete len:212 (+) Transcript_14463:486-1121(+)
MAGSNSQGILVAPSTKIPSSLCPTPCICTKNSVLILLVASFSPSLLLPHRLSISSIKITAGLLALAISKSDLTSLSDSPMNLLTKSLEETEKKVPSHSVAHALARKDLPVPGGPYSKIPFQGVRLPTKSSGNRDGKMTASCKTCLALASPATSVHLTLGFSVIIAPSRPLRSPAFASSSSGRLPDLPPALRSSRTPPLRTGCFFSSPCKYS